MDDRNQNRVKEAPQTFHGMVEVAPPAELGTGAVYRAKVFKSGNSLALRLPAALGFKEGTEMLLRVLPKGYALEPAEKPRKKLDVDRFWGKAKGLKVPERRDFEERPSAIAARLAKEAG